MNADKLKSILEKHAKWLAGEMGGERANLHGANIAMADLAWADLAWADLAMADLTGANLAGADLDFSCWPLWCGSKGVKVDARIAQQLAAHFCVLDCDGEEYQAARTAILDFARKSHRADDLGLEGG